LTDLNVLASRDAVFHIGPFIHSLPLEPLTFSCPRPQQEGSGWSARPWVLTLTPFTLSSGSGADLLLKPALTYYRQTGPMAIANNLSKYTGWPEKVSHYQWYFTSRINFSYFIFNLLLTIILLLLLLIIVIVKRTHVYIKEHKAVLC